MGKKCFSEAQIIMFVAFFGLFILITLPFFNTLIKMNKEAQHEKNMIAIIDASRDYLSTKEKDNQTIYVDVKDLIKLNYLSKDNLSGCVKITYNEKIRDYSYNYSSSDCNDIMTIKDILLNNIVTNGDGLYKIDNKYYFRGSNPNNYIIINNNLYRILSLDSEGIKIIRNDIIFEKSFDSLNTRNNSQNIYCMESEHGCNIYVANGIEVTQDSELNQYLENVYTKMNNASLILANSLWYVGLLPSNYSKDTLENDISISSITSKIGLINVSDYIMASLNSNYELDNWLNSDTLYWTMTGVLDNNYEVYNIGNKIEKKFANEISGIRPVININNNLYVSGNGKIDSPYIINFK